jgi:succinyl-CoA synthetase alpha subunit
MSILVDENTRLLVQGITGTEGSFHTQRSIGEYGTKVVAGVTPGKGGSKHLGVPVFNTVEKAMAETGANASVMFVPPAFAADGMLEAIDAGMPLVVCIAEGVPVLDSVKVHCYLKGKSTRLIGPNCPGVISPGKGMLGIMGGEYLPGNVGIVSRSGTLAFTVATELTSLGIGQSTSVGIGGDALLGSTFVDILKLFQADQDTKVVVLIGEVGGTMEQEAAEFISQEMTKPVVAFVVGSTVPPGKRMGHAGAIITGSAGKASEKIKALSQAGAIMASTFAEVGLTVKKVLENL